MYPAVQKTTPVQAARLGSLTPQLTTACLKAGAPGRRPPAGIWKYMPLIDRTSALPLGAETIGSGKPGTPWDRMHSDSLRARASLILWPLCAEEPQPATGPERANRGLRVHFARSGAIDHPGDPYRSCPDRNRPRAGTEYGLPMSAPVWRHSVQTDVGPRDDNEDTLFAAGWLNVLSLR